MGQKKRSFGILVIAVIAFLIIETVVPAYGISSFSGDSPALRGPSLNSYVDLSANVSSALGVQYTDNWGNFSEWVGGANGHSYVYITESGTIEVSTAYLAWAGVYLNATISSISATFSPSEGSSYQIVAGGDGYNYVVFQFLYYSGSSPVGGGTLSLYIQSINLPISTGSLLVALNSTSNTNEKTTTATLA